MEYFLNSYNIIFCGISIFKMVKLREYTDTTIPILKFSIKFKIYLDDFKDRILLNKTNLFIYSIWYVLIKSVETRRILIFKD